MKKKNITKKTNQNQKKILQKIFNVEKTKKVFLEKINDSLITPTKPYSIEKEFPQTKKNTNFLGFLILLLFCLILIGFSFYIINYFEKNQKKITLKIDEFSYINIKEILQEASIFKNQLLEKKSSLKLLEDQKKEELNKVQEIYNDSITNLLTKGYNPQLLEEKNKFHLKNLKKRKNKINQEYQSKIFILNQEIEAISSKVNNLDQKAIEEAIKLDDLNIYQKEIIDAKIKNIEETHKKNIQNINLSYEKKIGELINRFNPQSVSQLAEKSLEKIKNQLNKKAIDFEKLETTLNEDSPYFNSLTNILSLQKEKNTIIKELNSINFFNKTKEMNKFLEINNNAYLHSLLELEKTIKKEEGKFQLSMGILSFYLRELNLSGIVIQTTNNQGIIFKNDLLQGKREKKGYFIDPNSRKVIGEFEVIEIKKLFYRVVIKNQRKEIKRLTPIVFQ